MTVFRQQQNHQRTVTETSQKKTSDTFHVMFRPHTHTYRPHNTHTTRTCDQFTSLQSDWLRDCCLPVHQHTRKRLPVPLTCITAQINLNMKAKNERQLTKSKKMSLIWLTVMWLRLHEMHNCAKCPQQHLCNTVTVTSTFLAIRIIKNNNNNNIIILAICNIMSCLVWLDFRPQTLPQGGHCNWYEENI